MINTRYNIPLGSDTQHAPWNHDSRIQCISCDNVIDTDQWDSLTCEECYLNQEENIVNLDGTI